MGFLIEHGNSECKLKLIVLSVQRQKAGMFARQLQYSLLVCILGTDQCNFQFSACDKISYTSSFHAGIKYCRLVETRYPPYNFLRRMHVDC